MLRQQMRGIRLLPSGAGVSGVQQQAYSVQLFIHHPRPGVAQTGAIAHVRFRREADIR
jgi:hypothetical protein